jgi:hypothetical protein
MSARSSHGQRASDAVAHITKPSGTPRLKTLVGWGRTGLPLTLKPHRYRECGNAVSGACQNTLVGH